MPRYLIASGTQRYLNPIPDLDEVPAELKRIEELFVGRAGYRPVLPSLRLDPQSAALTVGLEDWLRDSERTDDDTVVIYYTGHGFEEAGLHYLATASTKANSIATAVSSDIFLRLLPADTCVRRVLVILDVCYAGQGARDLLATALRSAAYRDSHQYDGDEGVWIVAAARARDPAEQSVFTKALVSAYDKVVQATPTSDQYLAFESLFSQIHREFKDRGIEQRAAFWPVFGAQGSAPFLPNPHYDAHDPTAALYAYAPERANLASLAPRRFVGRVAALERLRSWPQDASVCIVTGRPGSGKSALLAQFAGGFAGRAIVAVQARGKSAAAVAAEIGGALGVEFGSDGARTALTAAPAVPATVVIDSLDESIDPALIADDVLLPLASVGEHTVRLVVGCRTSSLPPLAFAAEVIDLDDTAYLRQADVVDYAVSTLMNSAQYAENEADAHRIGAAIARRARGSFAVTKVVATNLAASEAIPTDAELDATAPLSLAAAFEADLERWGDDAARLRALLAPLAWAGGSGLPWATLWASLANALDGDTRYDDADIRWLLDHARAYVVESQDAGQTVFRVFHDELATYLRHSYDGPEERAQDAIVTAILASVPRDTPEDWSIAERYVLEHLADHALAAGRVDELLTDVGFLVAADVSGVMRALAGASSEHARRVAAVYSIASDRLRDISSADRAAILGLVARQQGEAALADALSPLTAGSGWVSRWADWTPATMHRAIARTGQKVTALAATTAFERPLVAIADGGGKIRIIDLRTDRVTAEMEVQGRPSIVAWLDGDHPWQFAAGDYSGSVRLWTELRAEPRRLEAHQKEVRCITEVVIGGRPVLVTGGLRDEWTGTLRAWDAETLEAVGPEFDAFTGTVRTVDAIEHEGAAAILAAGDPLRQQDPEAAGQLRVFDPITGRLHADIELSAYDYASTIAVDGDDLLVSCGKRIERWSLSEKRRMAAVETMSVTPHATLLRGPEESVLVAASWEGLEFYDAQDLSPDPTRMAVRQSSLDLVASVAFDGREAIVATDDDGTVRVWDPRTWRAPESSPWRVAASIFTCGSTLGVARGSELETRAADTGQLLASARSTDHPLAGHFALCTRHGEDIAYLSTSDRYILRRRLADLADDALAWEVPQRVTAIAAHCCGEQALVATANQASHGAVTMHLWNGDTGAVVGEEIPAREDKQVYSLLFAPLRGRLAVLSAGAGRRIVAWYVDEIREANRKPLITAAGHTVPTPHNDHIRKLALTSAGELDLLLSVGDDRRLVGVDLATGSVQFCIDDAHNDWIFALGTGRIGESPVIATGDRRGYVRVWSISSLQPALLFEVALDGHINGLGVANGSVVAATDRGLLAFDVNRFA